MSADFQRRYLVGHVAQVARPHLVHAGHPADREFRIPVDLSVYVALRAASGQPLAVSVAIHVRGAAPQAAGARGAATLSPPVLERNTKIGSAALRAQ